MYHNSITGMLKNGLYCILFICTYPFRSVRNCVLSTSSLNEYSTVFYAIHSMQISISPRLRLRGLISTPKPDMKTIG